MNRVIVILLIGVIVNMPVVLVRLFVNRLTYGLRRCWALCVILFRLLSVLLVVACRL